MRRALPLLTAACGLLLAGCGGQAGLRPACPSGELCLEYGNGADLTTLDPQKVSLTNEIAAVGDFFVGLTDVDAAGQIIPGMASRWEQSADGLVWTFHLREANWSDGAPVTADDFVFSLQRVFDPKTAADQASQLYAIKNGRAINSGKAPPTSVGARAVDARTLEITLEHPWPILTDVTGMMTLLSPIPRHAVAKWGDAWSQPAHYVGNGPYLPVSWTLGDRLTVRKNPRYFDAAKVCIDRINYYPTVDAISAERQVIRGELDLSNNFQSNRVGLLRERIPKYVRVHSYVGVYFLAFNLKDVKPLKDVRVRQALSMAIDRGFIAGTLLRGGQKPGYSYVSPGMLDYHNGPHPYWAGWSLPRRQAEARRLLAEAGFSAARPLKLEIKHRSSADPTLYMPAIQADWKAIGVSATLAANEPQIAYQAYQNHDFEVADAAWVAANDAMSYLSSLRSDTGLQNYSDYKNPRYDALLDAADNERDIEKRAALMAQAEQILLDDAPVVPLFYPANRNLVNPNITGWVDNAFDTHKARFLCFKDAAQRRGASAR